MPAPTNSPVITSVPLFGPNFVIGEVTNQFQPVRVSSQPIVIPTPLLGNEAIAGYAAFQTDITNTTRGFSGATIKNLVGIFANYQLWEGDVGTNPYTETMGGQNLVPVCNIGSIYAYNSSAIATTVSSGLNVVLSITSGTTPAAVTVGSFYQGSTPAGATLLDVSSVCKVRTAQTTPGGGFLVDILQPA